MIIEYDTNPDLTPAQKIQSFRESVQRATEELTQAQQDGDDAMKKHVAQTKSELKQDLDTAQAALAQAQQDGDAALQNSLNLLSGRVTTVEGSLSSIGGRVTTVENHLENVYITAAELTSLENQLGI